MAIDPLTDIACDAALRRLANGDTDALTVIYNKLGRQIFLLSYSILGDSYAAEDVMQEVFIRLVEHATQYRHAEGYARAYVLKITRNLSLNTLEKKKREQGREIPIDEDFPWRDSPPLTALEALSLLDEDARQIVVLKLDGGMPHRKIAALLGISTAACEKKYRRALEKLKKYYLT